MKIHSFLIDGNLAFKALSFKIPNRVEYTKRCVCIQNEHVFQDDCRSAR